MRRSKTSQQCILKTMDMKIQQLWPWVPILVFKNFPHRSRRKFQTVTSKKLSTQLLVIVIQEKASLSYLAFNASPTKLMNLLNTLWASTNVIQEVGSWGPQNLQFCDITDDTFHSNQGRPFAAQAIVYFNHFPLVSTLSLLLPLQR